MIRQTRREEILRLVQKVAADSDGVAPGLERFAAETGVKRHDWGRIWRTWSDVLVEAGCQPNAMRTAYDEDALIDALQALGLRLGRFPTVTDLKFEGKTNPDFPSYDTFQKRWSMQELAEKVAARSAVPGSEGFAKLAIAYLAQRQAKPRPEKDEGEPGTTASGYVYLHRHGADYKIGFTRSLNKRGRQIQIELPQEVELVHSILTDDPSGVEGYWHRRFADKRTRGEWFRLTKADVAAFRRWTKIW